MRTSQQKNWLRRKQQSQPNLVFLLMSPLPASSRLPVAFPVSVRFRLVLYASWVMDYLSAVSQYNDIRCCSRVLYCPFRKMRPLFISSLARQCYYYLALVFPPSNFNYPPSRFLYSTVRIGPRPRCTALLRVKLSLEICTFEIPPQHNKIVFIFYSYSRLYGLRPYRGVSKYI